MLRLSVLAICLFLASDAGAAWYLRLSDRHCEAVYQFQTGFVKLYENGDTRSYRAGMHPDIESAGVMMEIGYARLLSGADGLSGLEGTVTHYLDIPLWRTSNVMNKLNRCSDNLLTDR